MKNRIKVIIDGNTYEFESSVDHNISTVVNNLAEIIKQHNLIKEK